MSRCRVVYLRVPYGHARRYRRYRPAGRQSGGAVAAATLAAVLALGAGPAAVHAATRHHHSHAHPITHAAATAIAFARHQLGEPYVWGGTGPDGYDCSGLVMEAYAAAGVTIPRTSQEQWAGLRHIPRSQVRPGDLIFYAGSDGTVTSPGHVVMYIGGGKVIQAYATGYPVMISSLASMDAGGLTGYARP